MPRIDLEKFYMYISFIHILLYLELLLNLLLKKIYIYNTCLSLE